MEAVLTEKKKMMNSAVDHLLLLHRTFRSNRHREKMSKVVKAKQKKQMQISKHSQHKKLETEDHTCR
uniref:Uncharacterized protein n=2 Tax=Caenorhabditis japonica TaxID=281687 RepID=A0A8R1ENN7_CAEJA